MSNGLMYGLAIGGTLVVGLIAYKALSGPEETVAPQPQGSQQQNGAWSASDVGQGVGNLLGPLAGFIRQISPSSGKSGDSASPTDTTDDPAALASKRPTGAAAGANVGATAGAIGAR